MGSAASREPPAAVRLQKLNINVSRHVTVERDIHAGPHSATMLETKDDVSDQDQEQWKHTMTAV